MTSSFRKTLSAAALSLMVALPITQNAIAQEEDKVVVKVNGQEIRASDIRLAMDDILSQISSMPPQTRYPFVVEYLIERYLLAQAGVGEKIADTAEFRKRQKFYQLKALRDAYFEEKIKPQIDDEYVRKVYEEEKEKTEIRRAARARHIVVGTEGEAQEALKKVKAGEDFAELAKQISRDSAAQKGGDLGFFEAKEMVPQFSEIVFKLKPGEIGGPVETPFGWHIVKLEEFKEVGAKPFEDVKNGLKVILLRKRVQDLVADYRNRSKIELIDPDLIRLRNAINKKIEEEDKKEGTEQQNQ
ncbi:MAG: peptidylprolyl isomerase [Hyphomicrobiales bacterium]